MRVGIEVEAGFKGEWIDENEYDDGYYKLDNQGFEDNVYKHNKSIVKGDSSIEVNDSAAREVATGIYDLDKEGEKEKILTLFKEVYKEIVEINSSMGMHIHVSSNMADMNALCSKKFVNFFKRKLKKKYASNEELMSRLEKNSFCSPKYSPNYFKNMAFNDRYRMVNWVSYRTHGTVEFRVFDVPNKPEGVMEYVNFVESVVKEYLAKFKYKINQTVSFKEEGLDKLQEVRKVEITGLFDRFKGSAPYPNVVDGRWVGPKENADGSFKQEYVTWFYANKETRMTWRNEENV